MSSTIKIKNVTNASNFKITMDYASNRNDNKTLKFEPHKLRNNICNL